MDKFRKAILSVGTYHAPQGEVVVTPQRLKHWEGQFKKLRGAKYTVPIHWDHADTDDLELLQPIRMSEFADNKTRSARNSVGEMLDFKVNPDGRSAEIKLATRTKRASELVSANTVSVSPVLFGDWKDGAGNEYSDTIGSLDLVDYPVDHSQGPFKPIGMMSCNIIRMSSNPAIFKLSTDTTAMDADEKDTPFPSNESAASEEPDPATDTSQEAAEEATPSDLGTSVSDVVESLTQLGIVLPGDTTTTNFLERIRPALLTAIAARQQPQAPTQATELPPEQQSQDSPIMAPSPPQIAAMSLLQKRIKLLEKEKIDDSREKLATRMKALLDTGRIAPIEHTKLSSQLKVQTLSVTQDGKVKGGDLEVWIQSREGLPEGAVWDAKERVTKLSAKSVEPPDQYTTKGSFSKEREDKAVAALTRHLN